MSVQTEIDRLKAAKADLKSAIETKGVTVPAAATLDGYGALVSQIEQSRNTASYVKISFVDESNGAYMAFLKTRDGYQAFALNSATEPIEVEAGSLAVFALVRLGYYVTTKVGVQVGCYAEMGTVHLDQSLFGQDVYEAHGLAFLTDSLVMLVANSGSGGSSS